MGYDNWLVGLYAASQSSAYPVVKDYVRTGDYSGAFSAALDAPPGDYIRIPLYVMGYKKLKNILGVNSPF